MKALNGFMVFLAVILLLVLGGGILAHNFKVIDIGELVFDYAGGIWTALAGAVMLLFGILYIVIVLSSKKPEKSFSVESEDGETRITFGAIEDMLKKSTSRIDGIDDIRPMVVEGKGGLEILTRGSVTEDVSIPSITARINDVIKSQVSDVLGIEQMGAIRTYIYKIAQAPKSKSGVKNDEKIIS